MSSDNISPLAGKRAPQNLLVNLGRLISDYYDKKPDISDPNKLVKFGTSGHRGTSLDGTFTEAHILATVQAVCDYRKQKGYTGVLFMGKDTHALSSPAQKTALEVLAANGVEVCVQSDDGYTPTPVISHAIISKNRGKKEGLSDGIVITPSHNPPSDGGIKYNSPNGGPADTEITSEIQKAANEYLKGGNKGVRRVGYEKAFSAPTVYQYDYVTPYVSDLESVVDLEAVSRAGISLGADPLGGSSVGYWEPIAKRWNLKIELVNPKVDPTFSFMTVDHDGKIRMDCSSQFAMASLVAMKDRFAVAFGNDPDSDRHGIVTASAGLLNPNHYLSVAIDYLLTHRKNWPTSAAVGKTLVSSSMIDRVVKSQGRKLAEVPVGFKWFANELFKGTFCFGGEESAGANFLRKDGTVWCSDKDGITLNLLAAEIMAVTGKDPGVYYRELTGKFGAPVYTRIDAPANPEQKILLKKLSPESVKAKEMAGEVITGVFTKAPWNNASIDGLKVMTENGWFAARPSGTEDIYKIYAESFLGAGHLQKIIDEARDIVGEALKK